MKVKKLMTPEVGSCTLESPLTDAAKIMWEKDCGIVPVVDGGRLAGIITDRDVAMAGLMTGLPLGLVQVGDVMTADAATCGPDEELTDAHARMRELQIRRLPVIDEDEAVVGMLTLNDLVNEAFAGRSKAAQKRQRDVGRTLAEVSRHHELPEDEIVDDEDVTGEEAEATEG
jgi:CBS domain-containing protein